MESEPLKVQIGKLSFEVFDDSGGNWRWRCKAANGERVCTSGEAFVSRGNAERAMGDFLVSMVAGLATHGDAS